MKLLLKNLRLMTLASVLTTLIFITNSLSAELPPPGKIEKVKLLGHAKESWLGRIKSRGSG
jgi:hypothetical protein